jgi:hypothetical protein
MTLFDLTSSLNLPRGSEDGVFKVDLGEVVSIEKRQKEVAYVNKETAPELMYIFNLGYASVFRMMTQVSFEYNQAVKHMKSRKSMIILDLAPQILKEKGLTDKKSPSGNKDLREAILDQDEEYLKRMDKVLMLEAAHEFLKGKAKSFEMSYHAVKKIYDVMSGRLGNLNNLNGSIPDHLSAGDIEPPWVIGEPKFNE